MSDAPASRYQSSLETYSVKVGGRRTTVRLEPEVMTALRDMAALEGISLAEICTRVARDRQRGSLASALRLHAVRCYRDLERDGISADLSASLRAEAQGIRGTLFARERDDYVLRHTFTLDRLKHVDPGIGFLFEYWRSLSKGAHRPVFDDFRLDALATTGFDGNVHLVDVEPGDPDEFRIIRQAPKTMICRVGDNVPLRRLGDTLYPREVRADYHIAKHAGQPVLQRVSVHTEEGALSYERIILPCAGHDDRTGWLIVGVVAAGPLLRRGAAAPALS